MLALDASGANAFADWMEGEMLSIVKYVQAVYRSWAIAVHADITELTPQWTGNLAANWWLSANGMPGTAEDLGDPNVRRPGQGGPAFSPYSRGMEPAVSISLMRAADLPLPALSDVLYIYNPVEYAQGVEDDDLEPRIRPVNRVPRTETGKVAMVAYAWAKYSQKATPFS